MNLLNKGFEDLNQEDLGVAYESYVKAKYLGDLCTRFDLESMLEIHSVNSIENALVARGFKRHVILLGNQSINPRSDFHSSNADFLKSELSHMPFRAHTFDIVCSLDLPEQNLTHVYEMARVSSRFILIFVPNPFHFGHLMLRRFSRKAVDACSILHPNKIWISIEHLCYYAKKAGLKIVETGGLDAPPWPSHFSIGNLVRRSGVKWRWSIYKKNKYPIIIWLFAELERLMPKWLKVFQAHIVYVLASKKSKLDFS
jgi:hypothetical protein